MLGWTVLIGFGCFVFVGWLVQKDRKASRHRHMLEMMKRSADGFSLVSPRKPDMNTASIGFAAIALMRVHNMNVDLHAAELSQGNLILEKGGNMHEAMSARWGGVVAISLDLEEIAFAIQTYEDAKQASANPPNDNGRTKYHGAGIAHLTMLLMEQPNEYERFLIHMAEQE